MLSAAGIAHSACSPQLDEDALKDTLRGQGADALSLARGLARAKALSVATDSDTLVLGCDQTLARDDGRMIDKARDMADAGDILRGLSGRRHVLHSCAAIAQGGHIVWQADQSVSMDMRPLSDGFITDYLTTEWDHVRWCVGCYRIEGPGVQLFSDISGCQFAVRGLPLLPLLDFLRARGVIAA